MHKQSELIYILKKQIRSKTNGCVMFISPYRVKVSQCHPSYSVFEAAAELRVHLFHLLFMISAFNFLVLNNI